MSAEAWDWMRWVNAGLAGLALMLLTLETTRRWDQMNRRLRRLVPWVLATYAVIAYGSGELAASAQRVDPGLRVGLMLVVLLGLAGALGLNVRDRSDQF